MIKVGLTGNIGSGKTTVCKIFETLGVPVFYADDEAKKILKHPEILNKVAEFLGEEIIDKNGLPNRAKIASIVFNDKEKLDKLNAVIHPAVIEKYHEWLNKHKSYPYTIKEAAILFESGYFRDSDLIIVVASDESLMIKRVSERDGIPESDVMNRLKNQMPQKEKVSKADYVIYNLENKMLMPQVLEIHHKLSNN